MYIRRAKRELCGVELAGGSSCKNHRDTCPHHKDKRTADATSVTAKEHTIDLSGSTAQARLSKPLLTSNSVRMGILVEQCSDILGFKKEYIIHDYWLITAVHKAATFLGARGRIMHPYHHNQQTGHMAFGGGTSLSAVWDIAQRYSEDIDIAFIPEDDVSASARKKTMKWFATTLSRYMGCAADIKESTSSHCFFSLDIRQGPTISVDVVSRDSGGFPVLIQQKQPQSLLSRFASLEDKAKHPEIGGHNPSDPSSPSWLFPALGPASIAMDKLLAQTHLADTHNLLAIEQQARDVYDLAMLALNKKALSGHLGRDSIALLRASENVRRNRDEATRPDAGFASLSTFKEGTSEYHALERGYNAVLNDYVWGEKIPLNDAIRLALSLDPYEKK